MERLNTKRGLYASVHGNTFVIKKSVFELLGGYNKRLCERRCHQREDGAFLSERRNYAEKHGTSRIMGPPIYIFPIGRYHATGDTNPMGLFHSLSYEHVPQPLKE
jgi:hypothetical protein